MMRYATLLLCLLATLTACAVHIPNPDVSKQALLVTQDLDRAYARAQRAALHAGLQALRPSDAAHLFTATRPTGETVSVIVQRNGLGSLITIEGTPTHDVRDIVTAYQQER